MSYLPYVSWGMYSGGGLTGQQRAAYFVSWGLLGVVPFIAFVSWLKKGFWWDNPYFGRNQ